MTKRIFFRADGNSQIGMGHVMRCLSLADEFREKEVNISFIMADSNVTHIVKQRGFDVLVLNTDYTDMEQELKLWPKLESESAIIVDSYYVTSKYLNSIRQKFKTVYIDDLAAFAYPVDAVVNYNAYGPKCNYEGIYKEAGVELPKLVLGPEYAPIRRMFRNLPEKEQSKKVKDVLISTGGSDGIHISLKTVKEIIEKEDDGITYHFLIGALNSDKKEIDNLAKNHTNIVLHENVSDMKELISGVDICVSAAGSTMYEICACGVPLVTYAFADNQLPGADAFERLGLAENIGDIRETRNPERLIIDAIFSLANDYEKRKEIACIEQKLVDGFGAKRLADFLITKVL